MTDKNDAPMPEPDRSLREYAFEVLENFDRETLEHRMATHYLSLTRPDKPQAAEVQGVQWQDKTVELTNCAETATVKK